MELELGLKITKTRDDITSISEYQLAKDRAGPVFQSRETNTMFILTAHLKGYKRNNIHIKINEDGSKISISGEKPIQEMLMMGWVMLKKDVEITRFNKVFKIPDGVILDRTKAKYDEDEWILKIVMPKSIKGIRGASIEEMKDGEGVMQKKEEGLSEKMLDDANVDRIKDTIKTEIEESNLGIKDGDGTSVREKVGKVEYESMKTSDSEQNVGASIPQNIGDTSQDKESEIQEMEDSDGFMEKNGGRISEKMLNDANGGIIGETVQKEIEDGNGVSVKEKSGKAAYEEMKMSEIEQKVGAVIPQNIGDTSHDKESEVQETEGNETHGSNVDEKEIMVADDMLDNANGNIIGEMTQKEIEESKLGTEGGGGEDVREKDRKAGCEATKTLELEQDVGAQTPQSIGDTSQELSKEFAVQQMQEAETAVEKVDRQETERMLAKANGFSQEDMYGESKQKEFEGPKSEIEDIHKESVEEVISMERFEETKTSELDQDVADDHIPSNVGGIDQEESKECGIQKMEKTESVEGNMDGRESEWMPVEVNNAFQESIFGETIQKDIKKPEIETVHGDEECEREKAGKEGYEAIITVKEDLPKQLPKAPEVSKGLNVPKMKESKEVTEAMVKRKGKEIECFVKGEGEEPKGVHVEAKMLSEKDITEETRQEKIERPKSGIKSSDQRGGFEVSNSTTKELPKQVGEKLPDGSKGFKDAKMEEPKEVITEAMAETESLMEKVEGETSKKRTEKASRAIKKSTLSETLQKEDKESDIERKAKDGSHVPDIIVKGVFDVMGTIQVKVPKKVVEAMALDENDKTEYGIVKLKGEGSIRMNFEANKVFEEDLTRDRIEKEIREPKLKSRDQLSVQENIDSGGVDGSKRQEFPQVGETEDVKEEAAKIEQSVKEVNRERYEKIQAEANGGFRKDITRETIQKETSDPKIQTKERDPCLQEMMGKGRFEARKAAKEEFPMKIVDPLANKREGVKNTRIEEAKEVKEELVKQKSEEKVGGTEDIKDGAKIEQSVKKVKGEKYEKIQVETNGGKRKDITRETTQEETKEPKIQSKEKDQQCLQEEINKGRLEVSKAAQEGFLMKTIDSLTNKIEGLKDTTSEKAKEVKEELVKQHSEEKMEETEDVKDKGAEMEQFVKKEKGEKYEKIQLEASQGLGKDITRETTQKEIKEPKIQTEEKDQQCLQDAMSKGRFEASTTAREFPLKMIDSLAKRRDGPKDKKIEEAKKVKEEVAKRKTQETKVVESTTKEEIQESDSERITKTLQEVQKEKHPKALEIGTNERELQPQKSPTTYAKVVSIGCKEAEQGSAKKQKTERLSPIIKSKDTLESRKESADQDTVKSKKAKEAEKGEQCTYNIESTKAVSTIEDQVAKPRCPSSQQFEVEESKLQEGCKERYEPSPKSQKEYHTKGLQNSIEMKDQESKYLEILKPEFPLEELLKKSEQDTRKDGFQKGEKVDETMQEEIEQPKTKIDDKDQRHVQRNVGKEVGTAEIIGREMPKEEHVSNAGPTAGSMETKRDLEATLEREKYITQNVDDEKLRIKEEIKRTDFEKMDKVYGQEAAPSVCGYQERNQEGTKGPKISTEDHDKKGYQTTKTVDEELLKRQHRAAKIVLEEREVPKVAKNGEPKVASKQLHKREKGKTTQTSEDEKPIMKEITPEFEKVNGFKQVAERMQEPPTKSEIIPKKGMEISQREEKPPLPMEIQRKEPRELSWSSMGPQQSQVKEDKTEEECEEVVVEEQKEREEEEASGRNKDKTKRTKKLFVPLVVAGSALLVSLVFIFVHRKRAK